MAFFYPSRGSRNTTNSLVILWTRTIHINQPLKHGLVGDEITSLGPYNGVCGIIWTGNGIKLDYILHYIPLIISYCIPYHVCWLNPNFDGMVHSCSLYKDLCFFPNCTPGFIRTGSDWGMRRWITQITTSELLILSLWLLSWNSFFTDSFSRISKSMSWVRLIAKSSNCMIYIILSP